MVNGQWNKANLIHLFRVFRVFRGSFFLIGLRKKGQAGRACQKNLSAVDILSVLQYN